jgi:hypothetical protein
MLFLNSVAPVVPKDSKKQDGRKTTQCPKTSKFNFYAVGKKQGMPGSL